MTKRKRPVWHLDKDYYFIRRLVKGEPRETNLYQGFTNQRWVKVLTIDRAATFDAGDYRGWEEMDL